MNSESSIYNNLKDEQKAFLNLFALDILGYTGEAGKCATHIMVQDHEGYFNLDLSSDVCAWIEVMKQR